MKLYHASKKELSGNHLRTPTGHSAMDVLSGGVVYLTDDPRLCARYGTVYTVECTDPVQYADQRKAQGLRKKKGRYTTGVWVCLPENTKITGRL